MVGLAGGVVRGTIMAEEGKVSTQLPYMVTHPIWEVICRWLYTEGYNSGLMGLYIESVVSVTNFCTFAIDHVC